MTQLRTEKTRLQSKLDEVLAKTTNTNLNEEIRELKNRERKALESSKRFKKAYDFQRTLLNRKAEQYMLARARAKHLATLIRRHRIPLSPSAARLLADDAFLDIENPLDDISCIDGMMSTTAIVADNCSDDDSESDVDDNRGENDVSITKIDPDGDQQKNVPQKRTTKNNSIITKIYTSLQENDSNPKFISSDDKLDHGNICSTSLENSNSYNYDLMIQDTDDIGHSPSRRSKKPLLTGSNFLFGTSSGNSLRIVPLAPLGTDVPRSVLRMSPLIPRRKDVFARLADSASLNLASQNVNLDSDDIFESRRASIDYKRSSSLPENSKLYENNYICNFVEEKKLGSVSNSDQLISSAPNYCGMGKPDTPLNYDEEPTFERSQHLELKTSEVELFVESVNSDRILNKNEARHVRIMGTTMNPTKSSFSGGLDASSQEPVIEATNLEKSFAPPSYPMDVDEY